MTDLASTHRDSHRRFFESGFQAMSDREPFPWQSALFDQFVAGRFPPCSIPTGLGKTSVMLIWLLAAAWRASIGADFPRRLAYVVNRRTVVDQATAEVEGWSARLASAPIGDSPLTRVAQALGRLAASPGPVCSVSTLRGQLADNGEWRQDPARPAIVIGTVDMIGSRILFSGYGCGFKSAPAHAGLLGQDTLLVHDEAHLEPAFQALVDCIAAEQQRRGDARPLRVMPLTATPRDIADGVEVHGITDADLAPGSTVERRFRAKKRLTLIDIEDEKALAESIAQQAIERHSASGQAILIFVRRIEDVETIRRKLQAHGLVQVLTGTMRGWERDRLVAEDPVFSRFLPPTDHVAGTRAEGTVWLVCTSAGEVGVNISADHMVCDLSTIESMAQRFGRVNRFGTGNAQITVLHLRSPEHVDEYDSSEPDAEVSTADAIEGDGGSEESDEKSAASKKKAAQTKIEEARRRTLVLLRKLGGNANSDALAQLPREEVAGAFSPSPSILPATDILFDAWAMTTLGLSLPGRAPVADWLHGVALWEPPQTSVAWRAEVDLLTADLEVDLSDVLASYPLKPHERLRDRSDRVFATLTKLKGAVGDKPLWLVDADSNVTSTTLEAICEAHNKHESIAGMTVVLPPSAGGLAMGLLAAEKPSLVVRYDIADEWTINGQSQRTRTHESDESVPVGMRLIRAIDLRPMDDDEPDTEETPGEDRFDGDPEVLGDDSPRPSHRFWRWFVRPAVADDDGSYAAAKSQTLDFHLSECERHARALAVALRIDSTDEGRALIAAARAHDLGKRRPVWQRAIGNRDFPRIVLAKSDGRMRARELSHYRHELGSLFEPDIERLLNDENARVRDLALHLVASHHGRARPHFPSSEVFDPAQPDIAVEAIHHEVFQRYARLTRRYGRWGLAWYEALMRAADAVASRAVEALPGNEGASV